MRSFIDVTLVIATQSVVVQMDFVLMWERHTRVSLPRTLLLELQLTLNLNSGQSLGTDEAAECTVEEFEEERKKKKKEGKHVKTPQKTVGLIA